MKKLFSLPALLFFLACSAPAEKKSGRDKPAVQGRMDTAAANAFRSDSLAQSNSLFQALRYSIISEKRDRALADPALQQAADDWVKKSETATLEAAIDSVLGFTKTHLEFSFGATGQIPGQALHSRENCTGYASFFNMLMNAVIQKRGWQEKYRCGHYAGKIYFNGEDLHKTFGNDPFFRDHDFNVITLTETGETIGIDASLYDYLGVKRVALQN